MTTKTEELEQPAKQWQVEALQKDISTMNHKLDQLINEGRGYVTRQQLEESEARQKEYTDSEIAVVRAKYDPLYKLFWGLITAIIVEAAVMAYQIITVKSLGG